ncbi:cobalamin biosynthesis protein CbiG [Desulfosporosinus acidiphilus SJ4]|uniref:Cobalamin biosynthesis protein CbiG n=1 Tax=Desulfosporosinus acidiphilus (strain DSM 22704 / JCM 16185 / SJ4) TaxID=646529 RepID=I4D6G3_DESAJ|nr:cobalamin biosynthesis protein [Desulfosporosinus acidiphilus]AFM41387.1 cobalamin biosynthesis protein CbiG [Desulfosporosinus acidiphilus SJ4]
MKIALLAITDRGLTTALRIGENLPSSMAPTLYLHEKAIPKMITSEDKEREGSIPIRIFQRLGDLVPALWQEGSVLIFIMASGIVVRKIASLIDRKDRDPAVLVLDEAGKFVIPLLSGHLGGANAWARLIAKQIDAQAVITTATDGRGIIAPDEYARRFGWKVEPVDHLPAVNRLLLEEKVLKVVTPYILSIDPTLLDDPHYCFSVGHGRGKSLDYLNCRGEGDQSRNGMKDSLDNHALDNHNVGNIKAEDEANVIIDAFPKRDIPANCIYLIPPVLSVGVGCRRGVSGTVVLERITEDMEKIGASLKAISGIYSIDLKADEEGLRKAAQSLGVDFQTFSAAELQTAINQEQLTRSNFVMEKIGVDGVCEAASILGAHKGQLILPKTKGQGVTVAISIANSLSWDSDPEILNT